MSSFYGSGVSSYDMLSETPIKNLIGKMPVVFSELDTGVYNVKGNLRYTNDSTLMNWDEFNQVYVKKDAVTGEKVIIFDTVEEGQTFTYNLFFDAAGQVREQKTAKSATVVLDSSNDLPPQGKMDILYVTNEGIFVWAGTDYLKLGSDATVWNEL